MTTKSGGGERFDEAYYQRFYESKETRVYGKDSIAHLARGVTEMIAWYGGDIRSVLDIGAGTGLWRDWFAANKKNVHYLSTEVSEHACKKYGHKQCDISVWRTREQFDLVICQGVLPYLDGDAATRAIENIASMSNGFLYLEAVTKYDLEEICDRDFTDTSQRARTAKWYRTRLDKFYTPLGCGLYYSKRGHLTFYELEKA
ncbi:class I SAM-dependent methyltransferase [Pendulispora rubella]|uniref:Class I SAM-dependent methyltransferase n=1 Tax=Pendulispora rubella TaxID=2741070 RepID=A0ABZ2LDX0_9BACT